MRYYKVRESIVYWPELNNEVVGIVAADSEESAAMQIARSLHERAIVEHAKKGKYYTKNRLWYVMLPNGEKLVETKSGLSVRIFAAVRFERIPNGSDELRNEIVRGGIGIVLRPIASK